MTFRLTGVRGGRTPVGMMTSARPISVLIAAVLVASSTVASATPFVTQVRNNSIVAGEPTQAGRLDRNGVASAAGVQKPFPGVLSTNLPFAVDAFAFTNTEPFAVPILITLSTTGTQTSVPFSAAYLNSFDPGNIATNYLGDAGASPSAGTEPTAYSVTIPANTLFLVTVNETVSTAGVPAYTLTVGPLPEPASLAAIAGVGAVLIRRRRA